MNDVTGLAEYAVDMGDYSVVLGWPTVYEVPLCEAAVFEERGIEVSPWYQSLFRNPSEAWSLRVAPQGSDFDAEAVVSEALLPFVPVSLVLTHSSMWCRCVSVAHNAPGDGFLIGERQPFARFWKESSFDIVPVFQEVAVLWSLLFGFRESFPPIAGHIVSQGTVRMTYGIETLAGSGTYVVFFESLNGDWLIVLGDGAWGWLRLEGGFVRGGETVLSLGQYLKRYLAEIRSAYMAGHPGTVTLDSFETFL